MMRSNLDQYFMGIARVVATRATCDRLHVGSVIVREKRILATGYNGSIAGTGHCDNDGHLMENGHCVRTVHSEANAIAQAAACGTPIKGSTIYVTHTPCWGCFKLLVNAGIKHIIYDNPYRVHKFISQALAELNGAVTMWQLDA